MCLGSSCGRQGCEVCWLSHGQLASDESGSEGSPLVSPVCYGLLWGWWAPESSLQMTAPSPGKGEWMSSETVLRNFFFFSLLLMYTSSWEALVSCKALLVGVGAPQRSAGCGTAVEFLRQFLLHPWICCERCLINIRNKWASALYLCKPDVPFHTPLLDNFSVSRAVTHLGLGLLFCQYIWMTALVCWIHQISLQAEL